jgi:hypothetical protein
MANMTPSHPPQTAPAPPQGSAGPPADALTAAIRKSLDALDAAGEEAAKGRLGAAKLGLMVAATAVIDAFKAADDEFARRYDAAVPPGAPPAREVER